MAPAPTTARRHYAASSWLAREAARKARRSSRRGAASIASTVLTYQAAQAVLSQRAVAEMLSEQSIESAAEALLDALAFTSSPAVVESMVNSTGGQVFELDRLVESLVQDAGRAAESVATAVRPDIHHVRFLSPPSCGRCAVLAGRVYRFSDGFQRHPNCDCVMVPTTVAAAAPQDPEALFRDGLVRGLSKADARAVRDGADLSRVVNVRGQRAGLMESGRALARRGRPTPEAIYRAAGGDRDRALELLSAAGYLRP